MLKLRAILGSLGTALVLTTFGPGPVQAGSVSFSTAFLDSSNHDLGAQYFETGGLGGFEAVTFAGTQGTGTADQPFLHSLGSISAVVHPSDSHSDFVENVPFKLRISQSGSGATSGSADVSGSLQVAGQVTYDLGFFSITLDTFSVSLNQTSVSIGNINYQLGAADYHLFPFPHSNFTPYTTDGDSYTIADAGTLIAFPFTPPFTISARITDPPVSAVPEPSTLASAGSGAVALALAWLLRRPARRPETPEKDGRA